MGNHCSPGSQHNVWRYHIIHDMLKLRQVTLNLKQSLSKPGSIFQILTCLIWALWVHVTYLFTDNVIKSCDSPDWLIQTCHQSASSRVTETTFLTQKCFSVENLIIVSLNTNNYCSCLATKWYLMSPLTDY